MAERVEKSEEDRCSRKRGREREAQDEAEDEASKNASLAAAKRTRLPVAAAASILVASKISQLTIFYNGNVCVYDDVPPRRLKAVFDCSLVAGPGNHAHRGRRLCGCRCDGIHVQQHGRLLFQSEERQGPAPGLPCRLSLPNSCRRPPPAASPVLTRSPSLQSSSGAMGEASGAPQAQLLLPGAASSLCNLSAELPLARRNSLQRFLEKRRDRLVSKALQSPMKAMNSPDSGVGSEASTPAALYL
ncbi:unnamed protein product [Spirodela intermedia]|uniref:Protein TIFY n=1 Tax=Spirodela intermedia TaxID=51605 RepID=A0A7I8ILV0_SPIIN|nr:unnamed protein product [Spirodela intermedia]CAA6658726.1 unnamed protein product [Spirodela intermedia]